MPTLTIVTAIRRLNLMDIPRSFRQPLLPVGDQKMEWEGVPPILMSTSVDDFLLHEGRIKMWMKGSPGSVPVPLRMGTLRLICHVPEKAAKRSCYGCSKPLSLFRINVPWEDRLVHVPGGGVIASYVLCPACHMRKYWESVAKRDRGYGELRIKGHPGWGKKQKELLVTLTQNLESQFVASRAAEIKRWWKSEMKKNDSVTNSALERLKSEKQSTSTEHSTTDTESDALQGSLPKGRSKADGGMTTNPPTTSTHLESPNSAEKQASSSEQKSTLSLLGWEVRRTSKHGSTSDSPETPELT